MNMDWLVLLYAVYGLLDMFGIRQMGDYEGLAMVMAVAGYVLVALGIGIATGQIEYSPVCKFRTKGGR